MAIDKAERGYSKEGVTKPSSKLQKEPFVMLGSELLNSPAYMDLSFSARSMLIEILHYYNGINNGRIWLAPSVLAERGFSKNTASRALKKLRENGFIYMTKRGGNQRGGCSWFALTWLKMDRAEGQHLEHFKKSAYLFWEQNPKKIKGSKKGTRYPKFGGLLDNISQLSEPKEIPINTKANLFSESQHTNFVTYKDIAIYTPENKKEKSGKEGWFSDDLRDFPSQTLPIRSPFND